MTSLRLVDSHPRSHSAFTLIEVVLALGLLSILFLALVRLLDTSLSIWNRTESGRELFEIGGTVMDLVDEDLVGLETGPRGDLIADWAAFDVDGNEIDGLFWPRMRFVKQASAAQLARLLGEETADPRRRDLVEVCWALLPPRGADEDARALGTLWRGERLLNDTETLSFFDERFFGTGGRPVPGALREVTGGVLWVEILYAAQTTKLSDGWKRGTDLFEAAAAWDAWNKGRPDPEVTDWNERHAGMPRAKDVPLMPRRIFVSLELERPSELKRRTRLAALFTNEEGTMRVGDGSRVPGPGTMLLIDEEWMEVTAVSGNRVSVKRGRRGTRPMVHKPGTLVHHGARIAREIPIGGLREDWDL